MTPDQTQEITQLVLSLSSLVGLIIALVKLFQHDTTIKETNDTVKRVETQTNGTLQVLQNTQATPAELAARGVPTPHP